MKKENLMVVVKFILKYLVPVILAWLEGDSHAAQELVESVL